MALWASTDPAAWRAALGCYEACAGDHAELDAYWRVEYPAIVKARKPPFITLPELQRGGCRRGVVCDRAVMHWKFAHGKFRPLMKLVLSNVPSDVEARSRDAFALMAGPAPDVAGAIGWLSELRGVRFR